MARDIRRKALQRIAALSAASPSISFEKSDLNRLCKIFPGQSHAGTNGHHASSPPKPHVSGAPMVGGLPLRPLEFDLLIPYFADNSRVRGSSSLMRIRSSSTICSKRPKTGSPPHTLFAGCSRPDVLALAILSKSRAIPNRITKLSCHCRAPLPRSASRRRPANGLGQHSGVSQRMHSCSREYCTSR